ncbi:MAG: hypothetical protein WA102_13995 [Candidatus Methanoperedens sp.]
MIDDEFLVEGETVVYSIEKGEFFQNLYFTEKRLLITGKTGLFTKKITKIKDIMFHHISSIEWETVSYPWLLILGIILVFVGFALMNYVNVNSDNYPVTFIPFLLGVLFIFLYFIFRYSEIVFITESEKVTFNFKGTNFETTVKEIIKTIRKFDI